MLCPSDVCCSQVHVDLLTDASLKTGAGWSQFFRCQAVCCYFVVVVFVSLFSDSFSSSSPPPPSSSSPPPPSPEVTFPLNTKTKQKTTKTGRHGKPTTLALLRLFFFSFFFFFVVYPIYRLHFFSFFIIFISPSLKPFQFFSSFWNMVPHPACGHEGILSSS